MPPPTTLTIRRPDDWHAHFRDGAMLRAVVPWTARQFARAIAMPNLTPPVTTAAAARAYRERILGAVPEGVRFTPLMTLYLTNDTDPGELVRGHAEGVFTAAKLYPAHATTNSQYGVTDLRNIASTLEAMQRHGIPLLVHGEVTDHDIDIFDREAVFIERVLGPLRNRYPALRVVMEHITTAEAAAYVAEGGEGIAATVTPQHLILNRNALFEGGLRPHHYCLPVIKRERHRLAVRKAATSGSRRFFLGTDTAPHLRHAKEASCGCAGVFSAPVALECYAGVFAEEGALDRFEAFASLNGPAFYGLPPNEERIALRAASIEAPLSVPVEGGDDVAVFRGGETLAWSLEPVLMPA